jgi:hypothetical protein
VGTFNASSGCALPAAWRGGFSLRLELNGTGGAPGGYKPRLKQAIFGSLWGADILSLVVYGDRGQLRLLAAPPDMSLEVALIEFAYDAGSLPLNVVPSLGEFSEPVWPPSGAGPVVAATVENLLSEGYVTVSWEPPDAPSAAPYPSAFQCPITLYTRLFITDDTDSEAQQPAHAALDPARGGALAAGAVLAPRNADYYWSGGPAGFWAPPPPAGLPCRITKWSGCASLPCVKKEGGLEFAPPPWAGIVHVRVQSSESSPPLTVAYNAPIVTSLAPAALPSGGGEVLIRGTGFGRASSLGRVWNESGAAGMVGALPLPPDAGASRVVFTYAAIFPALEATPRTCAVLSWSDTAIRCVAPEGVGGTTNLVTVEVAVPASMTNLTPAVEYTRSTTAFPFSYLPPRLNNATPGAPLSTGCVARVEPLREVAARGALGAAFCGALANAGGAAGATCAGGGAVVTLTGTSLSRLFVFGQAPALCAAWLHYLRGGGGGGGNAVPPECDPVARPDASAPSATDGGTPFFAPRVDVSGYNGSALMGLVGGRAAPLADPLLLLLNHTTAVFVLPLTEGSLAFNLAFVARDGARIFTGDGAPPTGACFFRVPPPEVASLAVASTTGDQDADPCLAVALNDSARPRSVAQCIRGALALQWRAEPPPAPPCLVAQQSPGSFVVLELRGRNFGSGFSASAVFLARTPAAPDVTPLILAALIDGEIAVPGRLAAANLTAAIFTPCLPLQGGSLVVDETLLRCSVTAPQAAERELREGPLTVYLSLAFSALALPARLRAACPCGTFARATNGSEGSRCEPCPEGAACLGAFAAPVPAAGIWWGRGDPTLPRSGDRDGWASRGLDVDAVGAGPFVQCPILPLCMGNSRCKEGAEGWMCVRCRAGWSRGYDGVCAPCDTPRSRTVVGIIVALLLFLLFLGSVASRWALRWLLRDCRAGSVAARHCCAHWLRVRFRNTLVRRAVAWGEREGKDGLAEADFLEEDEGEPLRAAAARRLRRAVGCCCGRRGCAAAFAPAPLRRRAKNALLQWVAHLSPARMTEDEEKEEVEEEKEEKKEKRVAAIHEVGAPAAPPALSLLNPLLRREWGSGAGGAPATPPPSSPPSATPPHTKEEEEEEEDKAPTTVALLKSMLTFGQTFAALSSFTKSSRLPRDIRDDVALVPSFLSTFDVVGDLGFSSIDFKCAFPFAVDGRARLVFFMALPCVLAVAMGPLLLALRWARNACAARFPSWVAPAAWNIPAFVAYAELLVLPMCVAAVARSQNCQLPKFGGYQLDDPTLSCYDTLATRGAGFLPPFSVLRDVAWGMGVFYIAAVAVLALVLGTCAPRVKLLQYVFEAFIKEYRLNATAQMWECLALLRKSLLLGLSTSFVVFRDLRAQLLAATLLLIVFLVLHISAWPYKSTSLNWLEALSLVAGITTSFSLSPRVLAALSAGYMPPWYEQLMFDLLSLFLAGLYLLRWNDLLLGWHVVPALQWLAVGALKGIARGLWWLVAGALRGAAWPILVLLRWGAPLAALKEAGAVCKGARGRRHAARAALTQAPPPRAPVPPLPAAERQQQPPQLRPNERAAFVPTSTSSKRIKPTGPKPAVAM